jgi:hypothetical protein
MLSEALAASYLSGHPSSLAASLHDDIAAWLPESPACVAPLEALISMQNTPIFVQTTEARPAREPVQPLETERDRGPDGISNPGSLMPLAAPTSGGHRSTEAGAANALGRHNSTMR